MLLSLNCFAMHSKRDALHFYLMQLLTVSESIPNFGPEHNVIKQKNRFHRSKVERGQPTLVGGRDERRISGILREALRRVSGKPILLKNLL
jgi:hypothetical protein